MITCTNLKANYQTSASNGTAQMQMDAPVEKGGKGAGFKPHEVIEAAIAGCMNMWIRMYADSQSFPLTGVSVTVSLDETTMSDAIFRYSVKLDGDDLDSQQKKLLIQAGLACPVRETLAKHISIQYSSRI